MASALHRSIDYLNIRRVFFRLGGRSVRTVFDNCSRVAARKQKLSREMTSSVRGNWFFPVQSVVKVLKGMKTLTVATRADCFSFFSRWRGKRDAFELSFLFFELCQR